MLLRPERGRVPLRRAGGGAPGRLAGPGDITGVTTVPNRYRAFGAQVLPRESAPGLEVMRIPLPRPVAA
jgi:hypothetical protein